MRKTWATKLLLVLVNVCLLYFPFFEVSYNGRSDKIEMEAKKCNAKTNKYIQAGSESTKSGKLIEVTLGTSRFMTIFTDLSPTRCAYARRSVFCCRNDTT